MSAAQHTTLMTLSALWRRPKADAATWAAALRVATGADGCQLRAFDASGDAVVASDGVAVDSARFSEIARRLGAGGPTFAARAGAGTVEAVGLPLTLAPDQPPVGTLFLTWTRATDEAPEGLRERLRETAELAAVAVDRARLAGDLDDTKRTLASLEEAHRTLQERHETEVTALRDALDQSRSELALRFDYDRIVHASDGMRRVLRTLDKVSDRDIPVLILGDSGVGKELLARALHANGPRRGGPFVAENCGAVPGDLFESVFFGHVRGAFTGAHQARQGLVEAARGGTLFLDELGELRPEHQVKLLRVLQERRYRPVGGQRELECDFRLVAATNRDLEAAVAKGTFREDLYYRIAVVTVEVPPLRERPEDVLPLAARFLEDQRARSGQDLTLSTEAAQALTAYPWPGNVRELENEIVRASVLCDGGAIRPAHLSPRLLKALGLAPGGALAAAPAAWDGATPLADVIAAVERDVIASALDHNDGKKAPTARQLGLSRPGLDGKISRYGIDAAGLRARARRRRHQETT
jgi:two-component system response regulator HupR/HoxA